MIRELKRLTFAAAAVAAAILGSGCFGAPTQRPPRNAEPMVASRLAGLWEGTYRARTVDRDGRFRLSLEQRGDSLSGWMELLGVAITQLQPLATTSSGTASGVADIVRVDIPSVVLDGVRARMQSSRYMDPGCGCALTLALTGFIVADTLTGYFDAIGTAVTAPERGGRWRVVRVR